MSEVNWATAASRAVQRAKRRHGLECKAAAL